MKVFRGRVKVQGETFDEMVVVMVGSEVSFESCKFSGPVCGLSVFGACHVSVTGCSFRGSVMGMFVSNGATVEAKSCDFEEHLQASIMVHDHALLSVSQCSFRDAVCAILAAKHARLACCSSTFHGAGLVLGRKASGSIKQCRVSHCDTGVTVCQKQKVDEMALVMTGNAFEHNAQAVYACWSAVRLQDNVFVDNLVNEA